MSTHRARRCWEPNLYPPRLGGKKGRITYGAMHTLAARDPDLREMLAAESQGRRPSTFAVASLWHRFEKRKPRREVMKFLGSWERLGHKPCWPGPLSKRRRASHGKKR